ncbi:MAG TPA: alanine--tRNA ligase [Myxococcales bacterium]|jgi:alanyl-tRNA synthetase|nr:alanine--tRNA ligase [Myxococcales bacterium]
MPTSSNSPKPRTAAEIRQAFLRFFEERGHRRVKSSPLVPQNDPTLLFTNAGMVQFKDVFTGREKRDYTRAASSQKCVRAGGKHNDLENVGFTARHHTFFEMLGNFSFGDYFKKDAIAWAWEFMSKTLGLPVDRLAVTVFREDDEAEELWRSIGVRKQRIFRLGEKDNFWAMGPVGPCGPCSEIHLFRVPGNFSVEQIDRHAARFYGGDESEHGSDAWMEIWNLVFMQFERKEADGPLLPLPRPSIDTGAGLERVTAAVQDVPSNYDTDLLQPLIQEAARISGKRYSAQEAVQAQGDSASMRVVADHSRAASFLIADGVLPSNEGRGYVLRRILRRAIRHAQRLAKDPALYAKVCAVVIDTMGEAYPELRDSRVRILDTVQHETDMFLRTLDRGMAILNEAIAAGGKDKRVPGDVAFLLHDTYGFPLDLTQVIAAERGFAVDTAGFDTRMEEQRSRSSFVSSGEQAVGDVYKALAAELGDLTFLGYETVAAHGKLVAALVAGKRVHKLVAGEKAELVFDRTPFYGEAGGQVGDTGLVLGTRGRAKVLDAQKPLTSLIVHEVEVVEGTLEVGEKVELVVDDERRRGLRRNHSATHLLHRALRELLGEGVKQAGSVVAPDYLRFDYTAYQPLGDEQREQLEARVNQLIRENHSADTREMDPESAMKSGAIAFFGDKYTQLARVRVLQIGPSVELCGGTHVSRSGDIGFFKIQSESAIAAGVRRIVAVTGPEAVGQVHEEEKQLARAASILRGSMKDVALKAEQAQGRIKELERELDALQKKAASAKSMELATGAREIKGVKVLSARSDSGDADVMRELADKLRDQLQSGIVVLGGEKDGKATLLVAVTPDLTKRYRAGDLVKELSKTLGGRGGGKPEMAQAGGGDPAQLDAALAKVYELV